MGFHITQPGSSVATSLIDGESKPKHVLLVEIKVLPENKLEKKIHFLIFFLFQLSDKYLFRVINIDQLRFHYTL